MRRARYLMFMVDMITRTDKLLSGTSTTVLTSNGISCMLMNRRLSQPRVK
jgi:hypothetical protein